MGEKTLSDLLDEIRTLRAKRDPLEVELGEAQTHVSDLEEDLQWLDDSLNALVRELSNKVRHGDF